MDHKNILIVGAGKMWTNYAKVLTSLWVQTHVTDTSNKVLDSFSAQYPNAILYRPDTWGNVLLPPRMPTIIASNTPAHEKNIRDRIENGEVTSIFSEKPLGLTLEQTQSIEGSAGKHNADIYTGFLIRFSPAVEELRKFMKDRNLIMTTGSVDWGKNRRGDTRPTAWDLEDEAVHGMDILLLFASMNQWIDTLTISGKLEFQKYVDEVTQRNAHERDPSYPITPNSSASVMTTIETSHTQILTTLESSFVAPSERRYVKIWLADRSDPEALLYTARMDFDKRLDSGGTEDSLEIWWSGKLVAHSSQKSDKLKEQIHAWIGSMGKEDVDPRLATIEDALVIARWTDAVIQSHESGEKITIS